MGQTLEVVGRQIKGSIPDGARADTVIIAYEPVWAIGTGRTPTIADIAEVHGLARKEIGARLGDQTGQAMRILYGGSVKPDNAKELLRTPDVDGALVGGASLRAKNFLEIAEAYLRF
jgi:triosephosphate isomerase